MSRIFRTIGPYLGVITVFLYLLYVVGRTYISSYLNQLGIPAETMNFDVDDYLYYGLRQGTIILTLLFTFIFAGFIRYIIFQPDDAEKTKIEKLKWADIIASYEIYILFIFFTVLFIFAFFIVSGSDTPLHPALIFLALMVCVFFIIWCFFFLFDSRVITWIKTRKTASILFVIAFSIQLIFLPIVGSRAWGAFRADYVHTQFPKIQIESLSQLNDIQWVSSSNQTFISNEDLYWVIGDGERLILKSNSDSFYFINQKDILSIKFQLEE